MATVNHVIRGGYTKYKDKRYDKPKVHNTQICKACMGVGHCITNPDTICYVVAKIFICNIFVDDTANAALVKSNTYRYKKEQKEKAARYKTTSRMDGIIKNMENVGNTETQLAPMIHMANTMVEDCSEDTQS